jgi:DNA polymerase
MDALRRNQYLQTMGVDVWVSRWPSLGSAVATAPAAETELRADAPAASASGSPLPTGVTAPSAPGTPLPTGVTAPSAPGTPLHAGVTAPSVPGTPLHAGVTAPSVPGTPLHAGVTAPSRPGSPLRAGVIAPSAPGTPSHTGTAASATGASLDAGVTVGRATGAAVRNNDGPTGVITWESLRAEVLACTKCALHGSRTQGVFGVGSREAQWLVVGEAPGAEEDRRGEPFVGRAGHLLDAMLKAIGLSRGSNVYIANVLKSRPPGNRDPKPEEVAACLPYLMRQIELLRPRVMLAVGRIAAQNLLSTDVPLARLRGKVHHFGELNTPLIVTYHPAYLLRTPSDKRKAWEDLKFARSVFQGLNPT